jgi:hypothetical protein
MADRQDVIPGWDTSNGTPWNRKLDGEVILERVNAPGSPERLPFEFSVQKYVRPDNDGAKYFGVTPYRSIVWTGNSPEEVVSAMLYALAEMSRRGTIDPRSPNSVGAPPIQHVIGFLAERLASRIQTRHQDLLQRTRPKATYDDLEDIARDNEIIAAISTAIAALARVKDL